MIIMLAVIYCCVYYMQASNSCSYVQDAFQLLCPVLQFKRIQESCVSEPSVNVHARS